jgi:chemotaxis methyl-accepting protein methylase
MMENKVDTFTNTLSLRFGVDLSIFNKSFIDKQIQKKIEEANCYSEKQLIEVFDNDRSIWQNFYESLFIGYSEFFRNPLTFSILEKTIIPELFFSKTKKSLSEIRVWSAACSSGQEPYSIAMLLEEQNNGNNDKANYRIFASDQSPTLLSEASKGVYPLSSLKNITLSRLETWFTQEGDHYKVKDELKANIDFSAFDLLNEDLSCPPASIFGCFDLIVCSNVLFYYKPNFRKLIIDKIKSCLTNGGYLITGEAERDIITESGFTEIFPQSGIFKAK